MSFILYLSTKINDNKLGPQYHPYPHEDSKEKELINEMFEAELPIIMGNSESCGLFKWLYRSFLSSDDETKIIVSQDGERSESMTEDQFESLKKRLAKNCPMKEMCDGCYIDKGDCPLLVGWKKEGDEYRHSYSLLGEYDSNMKKVVLYKCNIDDACGKPTYKGVLPTYIHELFHAFFHYVTEKKQLERNYIREIEEAMVEFSTLVFLRLLKMKDEDHESEWEEIFGWASDEIGKKQKAVGNLPAYGFGRFLFDYILENKATVKEGLIDAFVWINKYVERLGYIDEEDELVKQYKQMVCPCYPTEPEKCLELLRKILFETSNKPIQPREVKKSDDGMDGLVIVDYTPAYESFGWNGPIHIEYDLSTDDFNYCNGVMGRWDLSAADIARIKAFLMDENNLRDFFDDRKAYSTEEAIKTEHYRAYKLHIKWKEKDKTITVGSTIPFKLPF